AFAQEVLLVHDAGTNPTEAERAAIALTQDLLGHFTEDVSSLDVHQYESHSLSRYDALVYLGLRPGVELPSVFLSDCYDLDLPTGWLGANLEQLASRFSLGRYGFALAEADPKSVLSRIEYRGLPFWRKEQPLRRITITQPQVCEVVAVARSGPDELPYAVRSRHFLYFAEVPLEAGRERGPHLILADQLHTFLSRRHEPCRTTLICVGPVTPETDSGQLSELLRELRGDGVICALEVSPLTSDENAADPSLLSQNRGLVGVLRGAQREGASVVVAASDPAEDNGGPRPLSAKAAATRAEQFSNHLTEILAEACHCGLYPVALSVDRGRLTAGEASALADTCSTVLGRRSRQAWERNPVSVPFLVYTDARGQRVLPDNVPPLREGRGEVEAILEAARQQTTVPDPWVSIRLSPEAPVASARLLVDGLRSMEFTFADLRHTPNWIKQESLQLSTVGAEQLLTDLLPKKWDTTLLGPTPGERQQLGQSDHVEIESTIVRPGTIVIAYPPGELPHVVASLEGDPQQVTSRLVRSISQVIILLALIAAAVLFLLYVFQALQSRGAVRP
ncbi:MAG: hypothetical protein JXA57_12730, partial [Armatimonadetes bacterium]|nr:hypothetical protein [Armatimonadota bacterium]